MLETSPAEQLRSEIGAWDGPVISIEPMPSQGLRQC
jgi:hypothetical protein